MKKTLRLPKSIRDKFCIFACVLPFYFTLPAQTLSIVTDSTSKHQGCVQVDKLPADNPYPKEALQVFLFPQNPDNRVPPIVGNWTQETDKLYFCPLIPFSKSLTYQARFPDLPYFTFKIESKKDYLLTEIMEVYPTLTTLPENVLKMYLYFSAPMSDGNGYQYIRLEDEKGQIIEAPFLELTPLLWNQDRTRLTLWLDPGRVKRELLRNQKMGAPLEAGKQYTLRISKNWKDANGYSLAEGYLKKIAIIKADRKSPMPKNWTSIAPKANTKEPVILHFGEALDHALAVKSLTVYTKKGKIVKGVVNLKKEDTEWVFTPLENWKANPYRIQIKAELEDLAGNNLNRLFDTDLDQQTHPKRNLPYYYFDFKVE